MRSYKLTVEVTYISRGLDSSSFFRGDDVSIVRGDFPLDESLGATFPRATWA